MAKTNKSASFLEEKLRDLKAIKEKHISTAKALTWKNKANMIEQDEPTDENDFRTQVSATVKRQKDSELSANLPEYSFIPMDDTWEKNRKIIRESWLFHWLIAKTDKVIWKVVKSWTTYWTGIQFEWIRHTYQEVNEPYTTVNEDWLREISFRKKIIQNSWIYNKKVPFANFYINWTDIDNSTECMEVDYIDKDEYIERHKLNPLYKNIGKIKSSKKSYIEAWTDWKDIGGAEKDENTVTELTYYNLPKDEWIVEANGIEVLRTHIPYSHKQLPYCLYYDNEAEDRIWGIWEFELLEKDESAKNEYRSLTVKAVKASIGFILKDRTNDLNIDDAEFGIGEVLETDDIEGIEHFAPNTPVWAISELEFKVDNDIVAKSGVDFKAQQLTPNESATKTDRKSNSSRKRINLNIRDNWNDFFRRLWMLRLSNIQQLHTDNPIRVPIEWGSITNEWVFVSDETGSFGSAIIGANFISGQYMVIPIIETMLGNSKQRRKDNLARFMEVSWNLLWADGTPVVKWMQLAKLACEEYGYDFEKLTESSWDSLDAQSVIDKVFEEDSVVPWQEDNPLAVPPAQRKQWQVQWISGQARISGDEEE